MDLWEHIKRFRLQYYFLDCASMEVYVPPRDYLFHREQLAQLRTIGCRLFVIPLEF